MSNKIEHSFLVVLSANHQVNHPWLENQAIQIEEALIERCPDILGPSVTANFAERGFELDLTVEVESMSEAYDKLGRALRVIEETSGIALASKSTDEVRSEYESPDSPEHESAELAPA